MSVYASALASVAIGQQLPADEPTWAHQPEIWEIWSAYPAVASRSHTPGRATIRCRVNSDGELIGCQIQDENPSGMGFGSKALFLSKSFRVQMGPHGKRVDGMVSASVDFTPMDYVRVAPASGPPTLVRLWSGFYPGYPFKARFTGVSGRVVMRCKVGRSGAVSDCMVVEEQPNGLGFGEMAVQGVGHPGLEAKTVDGRQSEGMTLETTEIINPPCDALPSWDRVRVGCGVPSQPYQVLPGH